MIDLPINFSPQTSNQPRIERKKKKKKETPKRKIVRLMDGPISSVETRRWLGNANHVGKPDLDSFYR